MAPSHTSRSRLSRRLRAKVAAARLTGAASRLAGRGGTSLPGKVLIALESEAIGRLAAELPSGTAAISATNGKTTTASMVSGILERSGHALVHNRAGANMAGGIAGALLERTSDADFGLFEIDEFWLDRLVEQLRPRAILLGNLFRDQLDRYGELETIAERWQQVVDLHPETRLVLNADDPVVADLGRNRTAGRDVFYFGIEDAAVSRGDLSHASDAIHCRRCGAAYEYGLVFIAHLGHYRCPSCGHTRPQAAFTATQIELNGLHASSFRLGTPAGDREIELPLPGLYNVYNALGAAALGEVLGAQVDEIADAISKATPAFGRGEQLVVGENPLLMMLVKNPTGANEVLHALASDSEPLHLLMILNDQIADGRDVSWIWDADYELLQGRVARVVCSGTRAAEMAVRLKYGGVSPEVITVVPPIESGLDRLAAIAPPGAQLVAMPTYTAMLALREVLVGRGVAEGSFA